MPECLSLFIICLSNFACLVVSVAEVIYIAMIFPRTLWENLRLSYSEIAAIISTICIPFTLIVAPTAFNSMQFIECVRDNYRNPVPIIQRYQWEENQTPGFFIDFSNYYTNFHASRYAKCQGRVIFLQTDTGPCWDVDECRELFHKMKEANKKPLDYNFALSSSGQIYEIQGWIPSRMFPEISGMVFAVVGNYSTTPLDMSQKLAIEMALVDWTIQGMLYPTPEIVGRTIKEVPHQLFNYLKKYDSWNANLSDY